ncbi:unnamed protein product [Rotaria sp. Silwood2]|nr:unnamed protein product [Rotaria sp. Silwood2]CAF3059330.1 unnamed protein product [Rotaria sp. Silwood2]CAF3161345.1 unnamed protein product [Rotaria sp. Silwood2]CAF3298051.1 unnamed protein product [Rotaria sp. Silwood2]CAF3951321.1 unnamed protein product [Rotaria sp. Silwood2]
MYLFYKLHYVGTLKDIVRYRCQTIKQVMVNAQIEPSKEQIRLFEKFENTTTNANSNLLLSIEQDAIINSPTLIS